MHLRRDDQFREWKTAEKRLCAQRASPERAETPRSIDELRTSVRGNVADMTKEMKEFLEKHSKDLAVAPERRGLDINRTPIMTRALARVIRDQLMEMHAAIQKLKGDELSKRAGEFRSLLTELNAQFDEIGMEMLYTLNGDNAEQFGFERIRFHYGDHYEYHIGQRRAQMPRLLPVPPELEDREPGLRNDVVRQQTALRVARIREQVATLEQARDYVNSNPEHHMQVQRGKIMEHYRTKAQRPPDYAIDVTPPSLADVEELGWALSALNAEDIVEGGRAISNLRDDFLKMGIVMEVSTRDAAPANALVGQRRIGEPNKPVPPPQIWEKTAANKWECALRRGETWTDAQMAQNTRLILNPRFEVKFRKLSVRDDVNEVEAEIRDLQAREEIAKQIESSSVRDSAQYYQAVSDRYGASRAARLLREYNDSLKLPDEKVMRHRVEEVKKLTQAGYDEQEKPVVDLVADINTRFERLQSAGKATEARAILERAKDSLKESGLEFEEIDVERSAVKSVRLAQMKDLSGITPRSKRTTILARREDMASFRRLTTSLRAYLDASRRDGDSSMAARNALDTAHEASTEIGERYKGRTNIAEKTLFEDRLGRLLNEAGYNYRGFNRFGDLTFEYRGRY